MNKVVLVQAAALCYHIHKISAVSQIVSVNATRFDTQCAVVGTVLLGIEGEERNAMAVAMWDMIWCCMSSQEQ